MPPSAAVRPIIASLTVAVPSTVSSPQRSSVEPPESAIWLAPPKISWVPGAAGLQPPGNGAAGSGPRRRAADDLEVHRVPHRVPEVEIEDAGLEPHGRARTDRGLQLRDRVRARTDGCHTGRARTDTVRRLHRDGRRVHGCRPHRGNRAGEAALGAAWCSGRPRSCPCTPGVPTPDRRARRAGSRRSQ